MLNYYQYFALKNVNNKKLVWSETYKDFSSGRDIITASYPLYNNDVFFGVTGIDIDMATFKNSDGYSESFYKQITYSSRKSCKSET